MPRFGPFGPLENWPSKWVMVAARALPPASTNEASKAVTARIGNRLRLVMKNSQYHGCQPGWQVPRAPIDTQRPSYLREEKSNKYRRAFASRRPQFGLDGFDLRRADERETDCESPPSAAFIR